MNRRSGGRQGGGRAAGPDGAQRSVQTRRSTPEPAATADARAALRAAAEVLGLGLPDSAIDRLCAYLGLLQRWNRVYNLTALRDPSQMLSHHLIDCLAVLPAIQRHAAGRPLSVLDVGSGGGLPGVVLAIAQPEWRVLCVDTVAKKAGFIRQVAAELPLSNLTAAHARVEDLVPPPAGHDLITSRAFASLRDFTALTRHLLASQGVWCAMKGRLTEEERAELPADVEVFHVEQLQVPGLDAQRCLVWMRPSSPS